MSRELTLAEQAERTAELRDLWHQFDPLALGAAAGDAYDDQTEPLLRVLEADGDEEQLATELRVIMHDFMKLEWSTEREAESQVFASRVMAWWNDGWVGTRT